MTKQDVPTQALPILVGLSGKRDLGGRDDAVRAALTAAMDAIDAAFPHSPKVLVNGLAEGADMLATELALARDAWRAFALLPMEQQAFAATFADDAARARLATLLVRPGLRTRVLRPVRPGVPRQPGSHGPEYEQLGLWLAENTTILLAVMPAAAEPGRLGGTARVVAHRLRGEPDLQAEAVIDHSDELAHPPPLQPPEPESVLLIDLGGGGPDGLRVLLRRRGGGHGQEPQDQPVGARALQRVFPIASGIDGYNRRTGRGVRQDWPSDPPGLLQAVGAFRSGITAIQGACQKHWQHSVGLIAGLFVLAVALFEAYAKFSAEWPFAAWIGLPRWGAAAYIAIVALAFGGYLFVRHKRWQALHEDYRAVNEVLRVQIAWWAAGITATPDRADRHYLVGASGTIRRVRRAAGAVITWFGLLALPPAPNRREVDAWIAGQIRYFETKAEVREEQMRAVFWLSWGAFFIAFGLGLWLAAYAAGLKAMLSGLAHWLSHLPVGPPCLLAMLLLLGLVAWFAVGRRAEPRLPVIAVPAALAGFLLLAASLKAGAAGMAPDHDEGPKTLVIVTMILLLACAGAVRFLAEKLVWEAEGHAYVEAFRRFEEAKRRLGGLERLASADQEAQRAELVRALGLAALAENGAWLRAHRERPLEPVVGG